MTDWTNKITTAEEITVTAVNDISKPAVLQRARGIRFDELTLTGFKSFVESTTLAIGDGLTGVVGPNGCGKSNLVEALRWVMGESSAKRMRGGEMDDVIFIGSGNRPARDIAEVSLLLDNTARLAPSGFNNSDTLHVTRRIYRGEGSAYSVNNNEVRAKDVALLFADASVGANSPALVSQGRVAALIAAKPQDRRALLEEAAGITGLHVRRHEAELRLKAAETNLLRLDDVLTGVEAHLVSLKKQARQAARYKRIAESLRAFQAASLYLRHKLAAVAVDANRQSLADVEQAAQDFTLRAAEFSAAAAKAESGLPALRAAEQSAALAVHNTQSDLRALDVEQQQHQSAVAALDAQLAQAGEDEKREKQLAEDSERALTALLAEQKTLQESYANIATQVEQAAKAIAEADGILAEQQKLYDAVVDELRQVTAKSSTFAARVQDKQNRQTVCTTDIESTEQKLKDLQDQLPAAAAVESLQATYKSAEDHLENIQKELAEAETAHQSAREKTEQARALRNQAQAAADQMQAEVKALQNSLTNEAPENRASLTERLTVAEGYETATAVALADSIFAVLQEQDAESAKDIWKNLGDMALAALPEGAAPLAQFVTAPDALTRFLHAAGVVETTDAGHALQRDLKPGQILVSRAGDLWRWDGYHSHISIKDQRGNQRLLLRRRLDSMQEKLPALVENASTTNAEFDRCENELSSATQNEKAARDAVSQAFTARQSAHESWQNLSARATDVQQKIQGARDYVERLTVERDALTNEIDQLQQDLKNLPAVEGLEQKTQELKTQVNSAQETAQQSRRTHDRLQQESQQQSARLQQIGFEQNTWRQRAVTAVERLTALSDRQKSLREQQTALQEKPAQLASARQQMLDTLGQQETHRQQAADVLSMAEAELKRITQSLKSAEESLSEQREQRAKIQTELQHQNQQREILDAEIAERLALPPAEIPNLPGVAECLMNDDIDYIAQQIQRLTREQENLGAVNLLAEDEVVKLEGENAGILAQREELLAAIVKLRDGIGELNKEGRVRLQTAFDAVNKHFGTIFTRLFAGGQAYLSLTDAEDPLDAGLEIMAQPPGKRLQNLSLLSGGEQALTALSLLFSVFLTNPSPICVLDEVDAPLDDANVDRFCTLLTETARATGTRFLVITHHRMTMARMDRLYGVTMAEAGVSQLVSVDLQQAERIRDAA